MAGKGGGNEKKGLKERGAMIISILSKGLEGY